MRWLKEGDANTKFFHRCIKNRGKINEILALNFEGNLVEGVDPLRNKIRGHYEGHFKCKVSGRPTLGSMALPILGEAESNSLVEPFSEDEIKSAVWNCESDKSPGPDGVTFSFIKKFWRNFTQMSDWSKGRIVPS